MQSRRAFPPRSVRSPATALVSPPGAGSSVLVGRDREARGSHGRRQQRSQFNDWAEGSTPALYSPSCLIPSIIRSPGNPARAQSVGEKPQDWSRAVGRRGAHVERLLLHLGAQGPPQPPKKHNHGCVSPTSGPSAPSSSALRSPFPSQAGVSCLAYEARPCLPKGGHPGHTARKPLCPALPALPKAWKRWEAIP